MNSQQQQEWRVCAEAHPEVPCIDPADSLEHAELIAGYWRMRGLLQCEVWIQTRLPDREWTTRRNDL